MRSAIQSTLAGLFIVTALLLLGGCGLTTADIDKSWTSTVEKPIDGDKFFEDEAKRGANQ